jgi:ATP-dependent Lon protease
MSNQNNDDNDSKHKMFTRSKRQRNLEEKEPLKKQKVIDSSNYLNDSNSDSDLDEYGNVRDLIDYDCEETDEDVDLDNLNMIVEEQIDEEFETEDDDEELQEELEELELLPEDIDNEEMLIGKLLSRYINEKMERVDTRDDRYQDILQKYDRGMRKYFFDLDDDKKEEILKIENEIQSRNHTMTPLRFQLLTSNIDTDIKAIAIRKIENMSQMDSGSGDYYKTKNWVEGLMEIPFGKFKELPVNIKNNTSDEITEYLLNANRILNKAVFGHKKAKCQILQIVSQWISNPQSKGSVFSIVGPMGNGKTTLVKEGISKMINRPFEFISLGGATDSCYLDGHSYTYEGSIPGKIVDILKRARCMNPVIYFDELDKVSDTPKGEEIINLLIHLTDFSQNDHFNDKYYNNIPIDLSKALFIFSLNDLSKVNPILRDRMFMIQTSNLTAEEKLTISKDYLIDGIFNDMGVDKNELLFDDEIIKYIVKNYSQEQGVRNLKRAFQTIIGKLNIIRITKQGALENLDLPFQLDNFELPMKITEEVVKKLVENEKLDCIDPPEFMYT